MWSSPGRQEVAFNWQGQFEQRLYIALSRRALPAARHPAMKGKPMQLDKHAHNIGKRWQARDDTATAIPYGHDQRPYFLNLGKINSNEHKAFQLPHVSSTWPVVLGGQHGPWDEQHVCLFVCAACHRLRLHEPLRGTRFSEGTVSVPQFNRGSSLPSCSCTAIRQS